MVDIWGAAKIRIADTFESAGTWLTLSLFALLLNADAVDVLFAIRNPLGFFLLPSAAIWGMLFYLSLMNWRNHARV